MRNDRTAEEMESAPAAAKKTWTAPALFTFPAGSANNTFNQPARGDGVTGCGS
jgi:hypothetical protein